MNRFALTFGLIYSDQQILWPAKRLYSVKNLTRSLELEMSLPFNSNFEHRIIPTIRHCKRLIKDWQERKVIGYICCSHRHKLTRSSGLKNSRHCPDWQLSHPIPVDCFSFKQPHKADETRLLFDYLRVQSNFSIEMLKILLPYKQSSWFEAVSVIIRLNNFENINKYVQHLP